MSSNSMIVCKPVREVADSLLDRIEKTYVASFPASERRDFSLLRQLVANEPRFMVFALLKDDEYVGFITAWNFDWFVYTEHFAIDESARNGGVGGGGMKQFLSMFNLPVVLEVEAPADEMSKRRIGFYERIGFVLDTHEYYQPPYREGESWLEMCLMTCGELELAKNFNQVKELVYTHVYNQRVGV